MPPPGQSCDPCKQAYIRSVCVQRCSAGDHRRSNLLTFFTSERRSHSITRPSTAAQQEQWKMYLENPQITTQRWAHGRGCPKAQQRGRLGGADRTN